MENKIWTAFKLNAPTFTRTQMAKLLNCTPLTISNREKKNQYPDPKRSPTSNHRFYTIQDAFLLQYITYRQINISSVAALLWDMGYTDTGLVLPCLEKEIEIFKTSPVLAVNQPQPKVEDYI